MRIAIRMSILLADYIDQTISGVLLIEGVLLEPRLTLILYRGVKLNVHRFNLALQTKH